ncbi:hypothetical protein BDQ17DRAFT_1362581 [Cyathus striatus]|nr:hypothetical protein BDQ17DRAFT_1362581 [Cyathus striatus]
MRFTLPALLLLLPAAAGNFFTSRTSLTRYIKAKVWNADIIELEKDLDVGEKAREQAEREESGTLELEILPRLAPLIHKSFDCAFAQVHELEEKEGWIRVIKLLGTSPYFLVFLFRSLLPAYWLASQLHVSFWIELYLPLAPDMSHSQAKLAHPDKCGSEDKLAAVYEAHEILTNPGMYLLRT